MSPPSQHPPRPRIDAWTHAIPKPHFDRISELATGPHTRLLNALVHVPGLSEIDGRFRVMDRFGDYTQVLTPVPGLHLNLAVTNAALSTDMVRIYNDEMAGWVAEYPDRFRGFAALLPMHDPEEALRELDRLPQLGALGVQIETNINGIPLDDSRFEPFFARMAELDRAIWVHPFRSPVMADFSTEKVSRYAMSQALGWPYETGVCLSRIVFAGYLERYPRLRIIGHHGGGMVPHFSGRLGKYLEIWGPKLDGELAHALESLCKPLLDYFRMLYVDTAMNGAKHAVTCIVDFFGADHVLFATDTPFDPEPGSFVRDAIEDVEALPIDNAQREAILIGNSLRVLGLP
jgi:aminocarboxymuconate-semialdehyde decarboxylase